LFCGVIWVFRWLIRAVVDPDRHLVGSPDPSGSHTRCVPPRRRGALSSVPRSPSPGTPKEGKWGVRVGALAGAWHPNYLPTWVGYVPRSMGGRSLDLFIARIFRTQLLFHRTPHTYKNRRNGSVGGYKGGLWVGRWAGSSGGWSSSLG